MNANPHYNPPFCLIVDVFICLEEEAKTSVRTARVIKVHWVRRLKGLEKYRLQGRLCRNLNRQTQGSLR